MKNTADQFQFLIDENIPQWIIQWLLQKEQIVIDVKKSEYVQWQDHALAQLASDTSYIVVTFDKDFLEVRQTISSFGCILFSLKKLKKETLLSSMREILNDYQDTLRKKSFLITVTEDGIQVER